MQQDLNATGDLRSAGAILLISCYELGHAPLGLASPIAFLERAGYRPAALDVAVMRIDPGAVRRARFVGISVPMHTALRLGLQLAARVREINPRCHLCFYGLYAPLLADVLGAHGADSILGGEYESDLVLLVDEIERGASGATSRGPRVRVALRRLDFAVPSRAAMPPLERYARLERDGVQLSAGYVEASRGCLHHCRHCPVAALYRGRLFVVPEAVVLADIRAQCAAGARHISFGDADFLNGPAHSLRILRAAHAEFPSLTFDFTAKVEHLVEHEQLLPELGDLGALFAISAVETLSDHVLAVLRKGHTRADVMRALQALRAAGIAMRPSFVPFTPWSTRGDLLDILDWVEDEDLVEHIDPVQYTIRLLVPPGSLLLSIPEMAPHLGPFDPESLSYAWRHPDARLDELQRDASALVARASARREENAVVFAHLRGHFGALARRQPRSAAVAHGSRPRQGRPPRLTESWFC